MKAVEIKIHNFRSICDATITLNEYGVLVGVNNAGKTTTIDAIRAFYGKKKFDKEQDFPIKEATDNESWVEIEFKPTDDEYSLLKPDYKTSNNTFRVRNFLFSETPDSEGKNKSGPYAYVNGTLSSERFYGFKNVGQGKFGNIIYIPAVSKVDDHTKLTGPSALRDLINSVFSDILEQSPAYKLLSKSFEDFEIAIKTEQTSDEYSIEKIESDISGELKKWGTEFKLNIQPVGIDEIIKGLITHEIIDNTLGASQSIGSYGQGFQRGVIYALICVAAKYTASAAKREKIGKKDFSPELTWILFEEPEAFLHATQIGILSSDLRDIARGVSSQVTVSTHNPQFATHDIGDLSSICRLQKENNQTKAFQISKIELDSILTVNQEEMNKWIDANIRIDPDDLEIEMEAIKYSLWLDSHRKIAFFSEKVLLVEGSTETSLLSYMVDKGFLPFLKMVTVIDTIGKYNIHRFMNLFGKFGIKHYVLYDGDNGNQAVIAETIENARNAYTGGIDTFTKDIEDFLGIPPMKKGGGSHRKPQHVMHNVHNRSINLIPLQEKIRTLISP